MAVGIYIQIHDVQHLITLHHGTRHIPILQYQVVHQDLRHKIMTFMRNGKVRLGQVLADITTIAALLLITWSIRDGQIALVPVPVSHVNHRM